MKFTTTGLLLTAALALPASMLPVSSASAQVSIGVSVGFGPPPLPVYVQPVLPGPGYIWVPGYWAYGPYGYYWVPGMWVLPPAVGLLWTPGYWAWRHGRYWWNAGYWGPRVGFYGGINYGYGYYGDGYHGGYWHRGHFYYNRAVVRVDRDRIRYTYNRPVKYRNHGPRVSYNGGRDGTRLRPTKQQQAWARERHPGLTATQKRSRETAMRNPDMRYSKNHGKPPHIRRSQNRTQPKAAHPQPAAGRGNPNNPRIMPKPAPKPRSMQPQEKPAHYNQPQRTQKPQQRNVPYNRGNERPSTRTVPPGRVQQPSRPSPRSGQIPNSRSQAKPPKPQQPNKKKDKKHPGG